jgi:hypothetical protein
VDSIGHRRLRPESAFTFPEKAARFQREGYEPVQRPVEPDELDVIRNPAPTGHGGLRDMRLARTLCADGRRWHESVAPLGASLQ